MGKKLFGANGGKADAGSVNPKAVRIKHREINRLINVPYPTSQSYHAGFLAATRLTN